MKKITYHLFCIILFFSLISCSENQPECDSDEAKTIIKNYIIDEINKDENRAIMGYASLTYNESDVNNFVSEMLHFVDFRKTSIDEKLKNCECKANIKLVFTERQTRFIDSIGRIKENNSINELLNNSEFEINYSLQLTYNKDLFFETDFDFSKLVGHFILYQTINMKIKMDRDEQEKIKIDKTRTLFFLNQNIGREICYKEIISERDSSGVLRLAITSTRDGDVKGEFGWYVNSDMGSWDGFFTGYFKKDRIYAKYKYFEEGEYHEDDIQIELDENYLVVRYFGDRSTQMKIDKDCSFPYRAQ